MSHDPEKSFLRLLGSLASVFHSYILVTKQYLKGLDIVKVELIARTQS